MFDAHFFRRAASFCVWSIGGTMLGFVVAELLGRTSDSLGTAMMLRLCSLLGIAILFISIGWKRNFGPAASSSASLAATETARAFASGALALVISALSGMREVALSAMRWLLGVRWPITPLICLLAYLVFAALLVMPVIGWLVSLFSPLTVIVNGFFLGLLFEPFVRRISRLWALPSILYFLVGVATLVGEPARGICTDG